MLFDHIVGNERLREDVARYFFQQLISALEHIHKTGYAHRDIKPENILLDSDFNLKIADFGLASKIKSSSSKKGTTSYMSPEILAGTSYKTNEGDLFAAAVVLFIMVTQNCPFIRAEPSDRSYAKILADNWTDFWNAHYKFVGSESVFSEDFKDLFEKMVAVNPEDRLTIRQIKKHCWFKGSVPSQEEVKEIFTQRKGPLEISTKCTVNKIDCSEATLVCSQASTKATEMSPVLKTPKHSKKHKYSQYFAVQDGEKLMNELMNFATEKQYKFKRCPDYFRLIIQIENLSTDIKIQLNILRKPEEEFRCVEAILLSGCAVTYSSIFDDLSGFLDARTADIEDEN